MISAHVAQISKHLLAPLQWQWGQECSSIENRVFCYYRSIVPVMLSRPRFYPVEIIILYKTAALSFAKKTKFSLSATLRRVSRSWIWNRSHCIAYGIYARQFALNLIFMHAQNTLYGLFPFHFSFAWAKCMRYDECLSNSNHPDRSFDCLFVCVCANVNDFVCLFVSGPRVCVEWLLFLFQCMEA